MGGYAPSERMNDTARPGTHHFRPMRIGNSRAEKSFLPALTPRGDAEFFREFSNDARDRRLGESRPASRNKTANKVIDSGVPPGLQGESDRLEFRVGSSPHSDRRKTCRIERYIHVPPSRETSGPVGLHGVCRRSLRRAHPGGRDSLCVELPVWRLLPRGVWSSRRMWKRLLWRSPDGLLQRRLRNVCRPDGWLPWRSLRHFLLWPHDIHGLLGRIVWHGMQLLRQLWQLWHVGVFVRQLLRRFHEHGLWSHGLRFRMFHGDSGWFGTGCLPLPAPPASGTVHRKRTATSSSTENVRRKSDRQPGQQSERSPGGHQT